MRTAEEAIAVPSDEPVLIELTSDSSGAVAPGAEPEIKAAEVVVASEPAVEKQEDLKPEESPLQKQLEDMRKAEAEVRRQLADSQARERAAIQAANQRGEQLFQAQGEREQAQYDAVLNAIGAAESEATRAENDYAAALAAQDFAGAAQAQRRMSIATTRLVQLEDGKAAFEARQGQEQPRPEPIRAASPADPIDGNPNLSGRQKEWLKSHRDAQTDPEKLKRLGAAHWYALSEGHAQDSDAYFQVLEERLGYRQAAAKVQDDPEPESQPRRSMPMSAPVTRESPSISTGRATPTRVELNPSQREAARISNLTDVEYARNLLRLQALKKEGHYQERG
jgi:hypothetical protein